MESLEHSHYSIISDFSSFLFFSSFLSSLVRALASRSLVSEPCRVVTPASLGCSVASSVAMPASVNVLRTAACNRTYPSAYHVSRRCRSNQPRPLKPRRSSAVVRAQLPGKGKDGREFMSESEEQRLVSFMTYAGITGSAAILGSRLAGIELFSSLQWKAERMDDFIWALLLSVPILLLDAVVLLPSFHTGTSPAAGESVKQTGAEGTGHSKRESNRAALQMLRSDLLQAPGVMGGIRATTTLFQIVAAGVDEPGLLSKPVQLSLELTYIWLRDFTSELLQRGLIVSFVARWLQDRAFEGGLDDVAFISPLTQAPIYTSDFALWFAGTAMTVIVMPAVISQAYATSAAVASCAAFVAVQDAETDEKVDSVILEWRMIEALAVQEKSLPAQAAYAITITRGLLRNSFLNSVFILSQGNLAASLVLAIITDSLLFAYCEQGRTRLPGLRVEQIS